MDEKSVVTVNAFEAGTRKVIPAVLVYPYFQDPLTRKSSYLMLHRNTSLDDIHFGFYNGLGGKLEIGESAVDAAIRECDEEAGLKLSRDQLLFLGVLSFPNFKPNKNQDWLVYVFKAKLDSQPKTLEKCQEGTLAWVEESQLEHLSMWPGDRYFIPHVKNSKPFWGTIFYKGRDVINTEVFLIH